MRTIRENYEDIARRMVENSRQPHRVDETAIYQESNLDNRKLIDMVLDRWPGKGYLYLKVRANDGAIYILRREDASGRWELWLFDAGADGALPPLSGR